VSFKVGDKVLVVGEVRAVDAALPLFCDVRVRWDGSDPVIVECDGADGDVLPADTLGELLGVCESLLAELEKIKAYKHSGDPWEENPFEMGEWFDDEVTAKMDAGRAAIAKAKGGAR